MHTHKQSYILISLLTCPQKYYRFPSGFSSISLSTKIISHSHFYLFCQSFLSLQFGSLYSSFALFVLESILCISKGRLTTSVQMLFEVKMTLAQPPCMKNCFPNPEIQLVINKQSKRVNSIVEFNLQNAVVIGKF